MLTDKIINTKKVIDEVRKLEEQISQYNQYFDFKNELESSIPSCLLTCEMYKLLNNYKSDIFLFEDFNSPIRLAKDLVDALVSGNIPGKSRLKPLSQEVQRLNSHLAKKWQSYATQESKEILSVLGYVKNLVDDQIKVENIITQLEAMKDKWPLNNIDILVFERLIIEAKQFIDTLNVSPEIQGFLKKVASKQARISDLNSNILDWIEEHNFSQNLRISFVDN